MQSPSLNLISDDQLEAFLAGQVLIWDEFFSKDEARELLTTAQTLSAQKLFTPATIGGERQRQDRIRSDSIYWLDEKTTTPSLQKILDRLQELQLQLNQKLFWGLSHFECHLAHYAPGQGYQEHIDQPIKQSHFQGERKISFVLYLNPTWQKGDGGEFIYKNKEQISTSVEPVFNRFVLFRSDTVPHSVAPAKKDRWSLTGWMRRS